MSANCQVDIMYLLKQYESVFIIIQIFKKSYTLNITNISPHYSSLHVNLVYDFELS